MTKLKQHEDTTEESIDTVFEAASSEPETLVHRLTVEAGELSSRLESLKAFIDSPPFNDLDLEERDRLLGQRTAMNHYLEILNARIAYHQAQQGA
jgi:hypothetical protein